MSPAATQWSPSVHRWASRKARHLVRVENLPYKVALRQVALTVARQPGKRSADLARSRRNPDAGVVQ